MTTGALPGFNRGMDELLLESVFEGIVAGETLLAPGIGFKFEFVLSVGSRITAQTYGHEKENNLKTHVLHTSTFPVSHHFPTIWHSSQDLPANGAWILSLKNFGSLEE
jgi:hypothetical protein